MICDGEFFSRKAWGWMPGPQTRPAWRALVLAGLVWPVGAWLWLGVLWPAIDRAIDVARASQAGP